MVHETVQAIHADLQALERQQAALAVEAHFLARTHALDMLTHRVLVPIEHVQHAYGAHDYLARLHHRATHLRQRLAAVNAQLFRRLQAELAASHATGPTLRQMIAAHVGDDVSDPAQEWLDTDDLDVFVNGVLDIDEAPVKTRDLQPGMIGYYPTPARVVLALIKYARMRAQDVFYDLGSGLGRVAMLVGLLTQAQVRGIEFDPAYCAYAQQRADGLHLSRVRFLNVDAREADYRGGTVFFLYTPFTGHLLQAVLDRLHAEARTRPITLAAYGGCTRDVARQPWVQPAVKQEFAHDTLAFFASRPQ